jgi:hypothetical protein
LEHEKEIIDLVDCIENNWIWLTLFNWFLIAGFFDDNELQHTFKLYLRYYMAVAFFSLNA